MTRKTFYMSVYIVLFGIVFNVFAFMAASPGAVQAAPTIKFREPSQIYVANYSPNDANVNISWQTNTGTVVRTDVFMLARNVRRDFDLASMNDIVSPFDGVALVDSTQELETGYFRYANSTNITLHDISATGGNLTVTFRNDADATVGQPYTVALASDASVSMKDVAGFPKAFPSGATKIKIEAAQAFERYFRNQLQVITK